MNEIKKWMGQLPIQILLMLVSSVMFTPFLSKDAIGIFYSISCLFKDALMVILPLITFTYMFASMLKFAKSAPKLLFTILVTVIVSNVFSFALPYGLAQLLIPFLDLGQGLDLAPINETIQCLIQLPIPSFWTPKNGMVMGLVLGIFLNFFSYPLVLKATQSLKDHVSYVLNQFFIPLIPVFVFGFFSKLQYEGSVNVLFQGYGKVLLIVLPIYFSYLFLGFLVVNRFHFIKTYQHIKESIAAFVTAFSTMSSLATMPLMLKVAQKHTGQEEFSEFIIPSVINIHMMGDGIMFSTMIVSLFYLFHTPLPTFGAFLMFLYYYLLARFSTAGVPGGTTLILMPLTISYLGFTNEMASVFLTLGIVLDSFCTMGNVAGNILYASFAYQTFGKDLLSKKS